MTDRVFQLALVGLIAVRLMHAGQSAAAFEVATIKRSDPSVRNGCFIKGQAGGQTFVGSCVSLRLLIKYSYRILDSQLAGGPEWLETELYDFEAKADHPLTRAELPALFQSLLAERFKLQLHSETRALPALALTVDKTGMKMKANEGPDEWAISIVRAGGTPPSPPKFKGTRCTMSYLSWWIGQQENRPVLDKTGLTGYWDFDLEFVPEGLGEGRRKSSNGEPMPALDGPTLTKAVREQLGLRLESEKGPVQVYVIDHVERPSAN